MLRINLVGQEFNKLLVVEFLRMKGSHAIYKCLCDCGNYTEAYGANIKKNHTTSCGCSSIKHKKEFAVKSITHGLTKHPLFMSWVGMRNRCYYVKHNRYANYGGKGIVVCEEWKGNFKSFFEWGIANGWAKGLSIDRIDTNKSYSPDNCRFSTVSEQNKNRTTNIYITYNGVTKVANDWAKITGVRGQTISKRLRKGWDIYSVIYGKAK